MNQLDIEKHLLACILSKPELINDLYIDDCCFMNPDNLNVLKFFKTFYQKYKHLDMAMMTAAFPNQDSQSKMINYLAQLVTLEVFPSRFYDYQEQLQDNYRNYHISIIVDNYKTNQINQEELISQLNEIYNRNLIIKKKNKITPPEMLDMVRKKDKYIEFSSMSELSKRIKLKTKTVNIIAARPSEGKSALAINMFVDLSKKYKCLYFNLEMTESEIYERMLGIESGIKIEDIIQSKTDFQEQSIRKSAINIYNYKYEIVNGSQNIKSIKSKIIKEQREEHLIVFIDYVGYVQTNKNQSDKDRIGEVVREINGITKDYDCTIFLIAQINRTGADRPTMEDLKDSGELEQTADTIMLIHDPNKDDKSSVKDIEILVPKARGGKRRVSLYARYNKESQKIEILKREGEN